MGEDPTSPDRPDTFYLSGERVTVGVEIGPPVCSDSPCSAPQAGTQIMVSDNGRYFPLRDEGSILDPER